MTIAWKEYADNCIKSWVNPTNCIKATNQWIELKIVWLDKAILKGEKKKKKRKEKEEDYNIWERYQKAKKEKKKYSIKNSLRYSDGKFDSSKVAEDKLSPADKITPFYRILNSNSNPSHVQSI